MANPVYQITMGLNRPRNLTWLSSARVCEGCHQTVEASTLQVSCIPAKCQSEFHCNTKMRAKCVCVWKLTEIRYTNHVHLGLPLCWCKRRQKSCAVNQFGLLDALPCPEWLDGDTTTYSCPIENQTRPHLIREPVKCCEGLSKRNQRIWRLEMKWSAEPIRIMYVGSLGGRVLILLMLWLADDPLHSVGSQLNRI